MALFGFIYWTTTVFMQEQTDETINAEILGLAEQYNQRGLAGLVRVIASRAATEHTGQSVYLLADNDFTHLAGNVSTWPRDVPATPGWTNTTLAGPDDSARRYRLRVFRIHNRYLLLVGRDVSERLRVQSMIVESLGWALGLTILLGLAGGVLMSRSMLGRVEAINRASNEIMRGDLSRRMPVSRADDEFDRLAKNLNEMLERIEKLMQGMREVSDNIAHDLRSPLTRLKGRIELLLLEAPEDPETWREAAESAMGEIDALLATFNSLLRIAQAEAGLSRDALDDVDLSALAADLADLYLPAAEEHHLALETLVAEQVRVKANRHLLSQAVVNLLDNAVKYTPSGGTIRIEVQDGPKPSLTVADTGPGIPDEYRGKALERFFRLEQSRSTPGSGLGLSLVKAVADLHRATLRLEGNDPGLRVTLAFPVKDKTD